MFEHVTVPLVDLLIDTRNARLKDEQASQQSALLAIAKQQGGKLLKIAGDIVDKGLNPLALPGIIPTEDQKKRYLLIEGNRRVTTLKGLETPSLILPAFTESQQKQFNQFAKKFAQNPITQIPCALFDSEDDLIHWVSLTHTGQNEGVGLVEWGADEQDRFMARHGTRSPAGQVLDLVEKAGLLSRAGQESDKGIITSLTRLISNPEVRDILGIQLSKGKVSSWYPSGEVAKGLSRIVDDLKTGKIKVGDIYGVEERVNYAESLDAGDLPDPSSLLNHAVPLDEIDSSGAAKQGSNSKPKPKPRTRNRERERTGLISKECQLNIDHPRINAIYIELQTLSVDHYANATSVLLRVFVELSTDRFITQNELMTDQDHRTAPLAKKMKAVASALLKKGEIDPQLQKAIERIADGNSALAASVPTFHLYVHNPYVFPKPSELKSAWDELDPFMRRVWP